MCEYKKIIDLLKLQPHPEGGYYRETYRSEDNITPPKRFTGDVRSCATGIYFMLTSDNFSAFHRFKSDETWFFHEGATTLVYVLQNDGSLITYKLGNPFEDPEADYQVLIKANLWFAAEVVEANSYMLASCYVAPGFDFIDFELADGQELIKQFPSHEKLIAKLSRDTAQ